MLAIGMHVEIQRSDGRIHGAVIAEVRKNGRFMVEWHENGETKGKESTLDELLKLNPTLKKKEPTPQPIARRPPSDDEDTFLLDIVYERKDRSVAKNTRRTATNGDSHRIEPVAPVQRREPSPVHRDPSPINRAPSPAAAQPRRATQPPEQIVKPQTRINPPRASTNSVTAPKSLPTVAKVEKPIEKRDPSPVKVVRPITPIQDVPKAYPQQDVPSTNQHFAFAEMIKSFRTNIDYRPLTLFDNVTENRISVCVRKRPMNKKESAKGEVDVVTIPNGDIIVLHQPQVRVDMTKFLENQKFRFDYSFDETSNNETVYRFTAQPLVKTIFEQGTATCFAYGQTGSGKTHTMGGDFSGKKQNASLGIYALTARDVFEMVKSPAYRKKDLQVYCAFFEIYGSKCFDLLNDKNSLRVLEDQQQKVQVVGLKEELATCEQDVLDLITKGSLVRTAGTTSANANSSRSHAVFQIILRKEKKLWGKFSLIDLAGNERGQDTRDSDRETRQEGAAINTSLLALKECIRGMARNSTHIPFRQSKLTMVLRDSFMGEKSRTVMISMISPGISSSENTLNTLRYADRVKEMGTDGNGDATPIRDEEMFLPPKIDESDEDEEDNNTMTKAAENRATFIDNTKRAENLLPRILEDACSTDNYTSSQKRELSQKIDNIIDILNNAKDALRNT
ncbi:unnamed protein product [Caenorhabditis angaria]|uniref:Kinesin-like protein n=1 Tax=Caenorhabditis angaria TaxID=860376 RepID=A0A9P1IKR6_9PELO|nr:unnamed protein product [Caenorhabditis angaria]